MGINCPPADIANGRRAIAQVFRRRLPGTRLIMMALLPVADKGRRAKCREVNAINAALNRNDNEVAYVDLQDTFLLPDGSINRQLFTDGTHLTPEGYRVWAKGIEPLVLKFMKAPPLDPVKIMLIGDSVTEGLDSDGSYRRYLDGMLRRDGHLIDFVGSRKKHNDDKTEPANYEYDVDHEGHWGKSPAWMAENMQSLLASNVPDVAVIHLGTEDIISSKLAAEPLADGIVKNIGKVVDTLRARNGNMNIVLSAIIPVTGKQDVVNLVILRSHATFKANATLLHPVVLADPSKGFDVSLDLAADGVHPNAAGAGKMARVFADAIHKVLGSADDKVEQRVIDAPAGAQAAESRRRQGRLCSVVRWQDIERLADHRQLDRGGGRRGRPAPAARGEWLAAVRRVSDHVPQVQGLHPGPGIQDRQGRQRGVFLRVGDRMSQVNTGFEIQILDTHGLAKPGNHDCGGVIGAAAPSKNMAKPAGQWNRYVITLQGKRLKVEMNGEQIHDLELDKSAVKDRPAEGYIGFQDEGLPVWYRNVRIKELK